MKKRLIAVLIGLCLSNMAQADRVAIIGGGSSGLVTAWLIEQNHDVTLYEAKDRLGGHANSIKVNVDGKEVLVEAGVDFFNEGAYPTFLKLLRHFEVPLSTLTLVVTFYHTDTDGKKDIMILPPFHDGKVEWRALTPLNWGKLLQLQRALRKGKELIEKHDVLTTLEDSVADLRLHEDFKQNFLYPLLASGWGVSPTEVANFSGYNTLKYLVDSYTVGFKWYEVRDGISSYLKIVRKALTRTEIKLNTPIVRIQQNHNTYTVVAADGTEQAFDHIVFATEPKTVGKLLDTLPEKSPLIDALAKTKVIHAKVAIHGDFRFMPPDEKDWRVANVRYNGKNSALTIYKSWLSKTPIFKTWVNLDVRKSDDQGDPMPSPMYALFEYEHSCTDRAYYEAQNVVANLQGKQHLWFAGVWTIDRDVHESSILSAVKVAEQLAPNSERIHIFE